MNPSPYDSLQIRLLGHFSLELGGQPVVGVHARLQTFLALVLLSPGLAMDRSRAAALLWPDSSEAQSRTNLRHLLHTLRSILPAIDRFLHVTPENLAWEQGASFHLDVAEFVQAASQMNSLASLDQALSLYKGDLLPTCFDDWIVAERSRLRDLYLAVLTRQSDLLERGGDLNGAIRAANRLLQADPLSEASACRLMELHASLGDRSAVLRTFEACAVKLKSELGVNPAPETRAVFETLMQAMPDLAPPVLKVAPTQVRKNNIPAPLDVLIGRKDEKQQVIALIHQHRLVTLTGMGGVGKTRLAQEIAWELVHNTETVIASEGIWWIDLTPVTSLDFLSQTVAGALHLAKKSNTSILDSLLEELAVMRVVLVLDNCEHLLEITAQFVLALLRACPHVRLIATSRVSLHLTGENIFVVPSLSTQESDSNILSESEQLFCERARALNPAFTFLTGQREAVQLICNRLDGIPLAIELAAAHSRLLSPIEIARRLENVFNLLVQKKHGIPPRHQTLRATLDWSYQLLSASEARIFRCLAVFSQGFTLDAAAVVCGCDSDGSGEMLADLEALIDKSLLRSIESTTGRSRSDMLGLIRDYAQDRLVEAGEVDDIHRKHALYFHDLAVRLEPLLESPRQAAWLDRLEAEQANLRSALLWLRETGDALNGLRLSSALALFHFMRGYLREGYSWLVEFLSLPGEIDLSIRAKACDRAGLLARYQGAFDQAKKWMSESLSIYRQLHELHGIADSLNNLGYAALYQQDYSLALDYYQEALVIHQQINNLQGIADSYSNLAILAYQRGEFREAESMQSSSLEIWRRLEDQQGVAWALFHLGEVSLAEGELVRALDLLRESLDISESIGFKWGIVNAMEGIACYAALTGQPVAAIKLAGGSAHLRDALNLPLPAGIEMDLNRRLSPAYLALGQEQSSALFSQGGLLPYQLLIAQSKQI